MGISSRGTTMANPVTSPVKCRGIQSACMTMGRAHTTTTRFNSEQQPWTHTQVRPRTASLAPVKVGVINQDEVFGYAQNNAKDVLEYKRLETSIWIDL